MLHDSCAVVPPGGSTELRRESADAVSFMAWTKSAAGFYTRELEGYWKDVITQFIMSHN